MSCFGTCHVALPCTMSQCDVSLRFRSRNRTRRRTVVHRRQSRATQSGSPLEDERTYRVVFEQAHGGMCPRALECVEEASHGHRDEADGDRACFAWPAGVRVSPNETL